MDLGWVLLFLVIFGGCQVIDLVFYGKAHSVDSPGVWQDDPHR